MVKIAAIVIITTLAIAAITLFKIHIKHIINNLKFKYQYHKAQTRKHR